MSLLLIFGVLYLREFLGCADGSNCKLRANTNLNRSPMVADVRNAPVFEAEGSKNQLTDGYVPTSYQESAVSPRVVGL